jgi:hypothetical protein
LHTTKVLNSLDFTIKIYGQEGVLEDIFPHFNKNDRLGIVVRRPGGGIGAIGLLMAAITRFYDFYRPLLGNEPDKLRIYPDFFIFHVGKRHLNYYWLDIWPTHKEVILEDDPELILEAINDRGITRLLVEDSMPSNKSFLRETISSAEFRIVSALAYSQGGRVDNGDVSIKSCSDVEGYVHSTLKISEELTEDIRKQLEMERKALVADGCVTETYRRIKPSDAILML